MYALSNDNLAAFLFDPDIGIAFPLGIVFDRGFYICYPDVNEFEDDFDLFDSIAELRKAAGSRANEIDSAIEFGQFYSKEFSSLIADSATTLEDLSEKIIAHQKSAARSRPAFSPTFGRSSSDLPVIAKEFILD